MYQLMLQKILPKTSIQTSIATIMQAPIEKPILNYAIAISSLKMNKKVCFSVFFEKHENFNIVKLIDDKITKNVAHFIAIHSIFTTIKQNYQEFSNHTLVLLSDNMYCIKSIMIYGKKWMENDFTKVDGTPVLNKDIIKDILILKNELFLNSINITFKYQKKDDKNANTLWIESQKKVENYLI
jgi:ribonuclease HI